MRFIIVSLNDRQVCRVKPANLFEFTFDYDFINASDNIVECSFASMYANNLIEFDGLKALLGKKE